MRSIVAACLFLLLTACSEPGRERIGADACVVEINQRLKGKTFEIDIDQLAASAVADGADKNSMQLSSSIVFDRGLGSEYTQAVKCRIRFDAKAANVISLEFIWAMDALKSGE